MDLAISLASKVIFLCTASPFPGIWKSGSQGLSLTGGVKKQPSQDVLHGDEAEEELGLARLVSSYTLPHQNSQPGARGRQTARSKVLSRRARDT